MPKAKLKEPTWQLSRTAAKKWGYRNVYALGFSVGIFYVGYYGLVSLQSSINPRIGLISLALLFASAFVAAFATPTILKLLGTKYAVFSGLCGSLLYTIANFYPSPYTFIPTSMIAGFTSRPLWAAVFNHSSEVAVLIAPVLQKRKEYLISKFSGVVSAMYISSYIFGNLASSVILYPYNQVDDNAGYMNTVTSNSSVNTSFHNDTEVCNIDGSDIDKLYVYILTSVYTVLQVISIIILLVFVDRLPSDENFFMTKKKLGVYVIQPLKEIFFVLKNIRMLLIAPLITLWGLEIAFALGTFTEVYIANCFGTYQVGFTLMVLGATSAIMCSTYGKVSKYIPHYVVVLFGAAFMFALLSFLLIWDRVPSYAIVFTFAIGWGCADGVWSTQTASLPGILFPKNSATAYGAVQVWLGVGLTLGFSMSEFVSVKGQLFVILTIVTLTSICSFILEATYLKDSSRLCSCCNRATLDTKLKLGELATSLSATNPMVSRKDNSEGSVSSNNTDSGQIKDVKQIGEEKASVGSIGAASAMFQDISYDKAPFKTDTLKTPGSVLNQEMFSEVFNVTLNPQQNKNVLNIPNPLLYNREEETNSNLCQLVKYSQSYMYALDNAVEMDATGSPNEC